MNDKKSGILPKLALMSAMTVFGTIGLFRRLIPLPSGAVAFCRGFIGAIALILIMMIARKKTDMAAIRKNLLLLIVSGALIGFNWILLFEAYNYTSVATATLCYYIAPILVIIASPFVLKEKLCLRRALCVAFALAGMVLVSGVLYGGSIDGLGIAFGLGAAVLYASVILINRKIQGLTAYDKTVVQLIAATAVILPYTLLAEEIEMSVFTPSVIWLILLVGVVHTGISYAMYFGALGKVTAQSAAIFSYIDPVVAILLSALVLHEQMRVLEIVGAVLIIGAALASELPDRRK